MLLFSTLQSGAYILMIPDYHRPNQIELVTSNLSQSDEEYIFNDLKK